MRVRMFTGYTGSGALVVGWNLNLQSSFGVTNEEVASVGNSVLRLAESSGRTIQQDHKRRRQGGSLSPLSRKSAS